MATPEEMRITVTTNGPYRVTGSVPLVPRTIVTDEEGFSVEWGEGEPFTTEATYELCRCGATKTAPFCDRACEDGGFDGTETASREPYLSQADEQVGPNLILTDAEVLCSFARFCDFGGRVWNLVEEPDEESKDVAISDAKLCPSGRLIAWERATQQSLRGGLSAVDRRGPGSDPRVLRSARGARGHPGDGGRRLRLRTAEPADPVSVRAFEQQAVLRRDPCRDRLRRRPAFDQWPLIRDLNARGAMVRSPERSDDHGAGGAPTMFASASRTVS